MLTSMIRNLEINTSTTILLSHEAIVNIMFLIAIKAELPELQVFVTAL